MQTNFVVLDSKIASGLKKIIDKDIKRTVFKMHKKTLSHWNVSRMDDL